MAGGTRMGGNNDDDGIFDINVTPFVDVVLVLLVIFMVTAGFIVNRGVHVELPEATTSDKLKEQITFQIIVKQDGTVVLNGEDATIASLKQKGQYAKQKSDKITVMISADKGVVYSTVVEVMDALRQVGIADFALQMDAK